MLPQTPSMRQKRQNIQQFILSTSFRFGLLAVTCLMLTIHVVKRSSISTQGYEISKLQKQIQTLEEEKQRVDIDIAKLSSMDHIQEKVRQMQFVPIEKPQYISVHGSSVAKR